MRIAILCPPSWNMENPHARFTAKLADAFVKNGHDVTVLAPEGFKTMASVELLPEENKKTCCLDSALHALSIFDREDEFDIAHSMASPTVLSVSRFVQTPILTTIFEKPGNKELPVYKRHGDGTYIAAEKGMEPEEGLTITAFINHESEDCFNDYLDLYSKILKATVREDSRPWGRFTVLEDASDHKVKRITVYSGKRLSLQKHARRSEHWMVIKGEAVVTLNESEITLKAGESVNIPAGAAHRVLNPGQEPLVFIEIQTGSYFGEDDILRLEDDFGRA